MRQAARGLAAILAVLVALIGVGGVLAPAALLDLGRSLDSPRALLVAAGSRVVFGLLLLVCAPGSRAPRTLKVLGALIVVAGIATPFLGVERARAMLDWWAAQGSAFVRLWSLLAVAFGGLVLWALRRARAAA